TMQKPFSYIVQYTSFGVNDEIWDGTGKVLATVQKRALREAPDSTADDNGFGGRQGGDGPRRGLAWMPSGPGMYYIASDAPARGASANDPAAPRGGPGRSLRRRRPPGWGRSGECRGRSCRRTRRSRRRGGWESPRPPDQMAGTV